MERVSWVSDALELMHHLRDDELQRHVRLFVQVAKECNGGARCRGIDVLDFEEDSLIHALHLNEQVGL